MLATILPFINGYNIRLDVIKISHYNVIRKYYDHVQNVLFQKQIISLIKYSGQLCGQ